jgi:hypothetical protein
MEFWKNIYALDKYIEYIRTSWIASNVAFEWDIIIIITNIMGHW